MVSPRHSWVSLLLVLLSSIVAAALDMSSRRVLKQCGRKRSWREGLALLVDLRESDDAAAASSGAPVALPAPLVVDYFETARAEAAQRSRGLSKRQQGSARTVKDGRRSRSRVELSLAVRQFWATWRQGIADASPQGAVEMYEDAERVGLMQGALTTTATAMGGIEGPSLLLDLHGMSVPMAEAAVRSVLGRLHRGEACLRPEHRGACLGGITVVTGRGRHSPDGEAKIRAAIMPLFENAASGPSSEGAFELGGGGAVCLGPTWVAEWKHLPPAAVEGQLGVRLLGNALEQLEDIEQEGAHGWFPPHRRGLQERRLSQ
jgi:hypothetical protein